MTYACSPIIQRRYRFIVNRTSFRKAAVSFLCITCNRALVFYQQRARPEQAETVVYMYVPGGLRRDLTPACSSAHARMTGSKRSGEGA